MGFPLRARGLQHSCFFGGGSGHHFKAVWRARCWKSRAFIVFYKISIRINIQITNIILYSTVSSKNQTVLAYAETFMRVFSIRWRARERFIFEPDRPNGILFYCASPRPAVSSCAAPTRSARDLCGSRRGVRRMVGREVKELFANRTFRLENYASSHF